MIVHTKTPAELFTYDFDFAGEFPSGDTVASSTITTSPSGLTVGAKVETGSIVQVPLSSGVDGTNYTITVTGTATGGTVAQLVLLLRVRAMLPRTIDDVLTRTELITQAFRKLRVLAPGGTANATQLAAGVSALNLITREQSAVGKALRATWAIGHATLPLTNGAGSFTVNEGLVEDLEELLDIQYRDISGVDYPMEILTAAQYAELPDKDAVGTPCAAWLTGAVRTRDRRLLIWPRRPTVEAPWRVTGTDGRPYRCIMRHTGIESARPITGANWRLFWELDTQTSIAWAVDTAYTHGELIRYSYRRPLLSFSAATDDPDMPPEWTRFLLYRLAHDLSFDFKAEKALRDDLKIEYLQAYEVIAPNSYPESSDYHNKVTFF